MFERFTERSRKVMNLARQEAQRFNSGFIGAEHILLGLLREGGGIVARVLKGLHVDIRRLRKEVEKLIPPAASPVGEDPPSKEPPIPPPMLR